VEEFQADLEAYLDGRRLQAASYSPIEIVGKWIGRHRKACAGAGAVFLLAAGFFGFQLLKQRQDRAKKIDLARGEAVRLVTAEGDISDLIGPATPVDPQTGLARYDSPEERGRRERVMAAYARASGALQRALLIDPEDEDLRERRRDIGRALGMMALRNHDYFLARQSFEDLQTYGVQESEVLRLTDEVQREQQAIIDFRRVRLGLILSSLEQGLYRQGRSPGEPLLEDFVFEAVGYRDRNTVVFLAENLHLLTEKAIREGAEVIWTEGERMRAKFICRVLGRLGWPECVESLGAWMEVIRSYELVREAGIALCNTRSEHAEPYLLRARNRLDINSKLWRQIEPYFDRVPEFEGGSAPDTAEAYFIRGDGRRGKGNRKGAIEDFDRAIQIDPEYAAAYNSRGISRDAGGDLDGAIADYDRAIEIDPRYADAYLNRGRARTAKGDLAGAIADCDRAIEIDPRDIYAYITRGNARNSRGDLAGAFEDYDRAIELDPRFAMAYVNRGNVRDKMGNSDGAIADYTLATELDPRLVEAWFNLGRAWKAKGDPGRAIANLTRAIEIDPRFAMAYANRGLARKARGDLDGAIEDYTRAIEIDPLHPDTYYNRGNARTSKGDRAGAIEDYTASIEIEPRNAEAYIGRGNARNRGGDLSGAIEDYDRAIEIDPQYALAHYNRARVRHASGDVPGALVDYDRAIAIDPRYAEAYYNRALVRQGKGNRNGAMEDYSRAIEFRPHFAEAYTNRGVLRAARSDHLGAIADYTMALEIAPAHWRYREKTEGLLAKARKALDRE
jgi:tetratricopeptide (TPR) repeat protein